MKLKFAYIFALLLLFCIHANGQLSSCANADFEQNNFTNWVGTTGSCCPINSTVPGIVPGRHTIMSGPGTDPNTNGALSVVAPGGQFSARLGNENIGAEAEQLSYQFSVDPTNALFIYRYAVVFEDPSHTAEEQPRFEIRVYDIAGNTISCGVYNVYSSTGISGFVTTTNQFGSTIHYKDWTTVGIDLSPYIGQTVTIEFSTGDCALGGHFGYAYIDCYCSPLQIQSDFCDGSNTSTLTAPIGFAAYLWSTGDTTQSITIQNPVIGTQYTCTMTAVTGCTVTLTSIVTPTIIASSFGDGFACQNATQFYDSSKVITGSAINQWLWNFGDGTSSTLQNPLHNFPNPGPYTVSLTVTNSIGCKDTIIQNVTIDPPPVANFSSPGYCPFSTVNFTDQSFSPNGPITNWEWNFGDGTSTSQLSNPNHIYSSTTGYTVALVITDSIGCKDTLQQNISPYDLPNVAFNNTANCVNTLVNFTNQTTIATGTITNYNWNFGDGTGTINSINATHTFTNAGSYPVTLYATSNNGCVDSTTNTVTNLPNPTSNFSTTSVCPGDSVVFTDLTTSPSSTIANWSWNFGDGSAIVNGIQNPAHPYANAGNYTATLIITDANGCIDTTQGLVTIKTKPTAAFNLLGPYCIGVGIPTSNTSSSINSAIISYLWNSDGTTSTSPNPVFIYPQSGTYPVKLIVTNSNGCVDSTTNNAIINAKPAPTIQTTNTCAYEALQLIGGSVGTGTIANWNWNTGNGQTDTNQIVNVTYTQPGNFNVYLSVKDINGCIGDTTQSITIYPKPTASIITSDKCLVDSVFVFDNSTIAQGQFINSWSWNFGDGSPLVSQKNSNHQYSQDSTYSISLIVSSNLGCVDTANYQITIYPQPKISFIADTVCEGKSTQFANNSTINSGSINEWKWSLGDGNTSLSSTPLHLYANAAIYPVQLIATSDKGCVDSLTKDVRVWYNPNAEFKATDTTLCDDYDLILNDKSTSLEGSIVAWYWKFGNGDKSVLQNPIYNYPNPGTYDISLRVTTNLGCTDEKINQNYLRVYPTPTADFTYNPMNASVYQPEIYFYDLSTGASIWNWNLGDATTTSDVNPVHIYAEPGNYKVTLIVENNIGCKDTTWKYIDIKSDYAIWIPNSFSPNNDGKNDFFFGKGFGFTNYELSIYDRWGEKIFESNDPEIGWDGTCKGVESAIDVYVYVISIVDIFNEPHTYNGRVSLIR
jgi:gliding motility-associated-like protein